MKNKILLILFGLIILSNQFALADPASKDTSQTAQTKNSGQKGEDDDGFASHKTQWAKDLGEVKSGVEQVLNCVNSAKSQDDLKKCRTIQKENREKMHDRRVANRKERLQNELKKLDSESSTTKK